jgi:hypothetical protein
MLWRTGAGGWAMVGKAVLRVFLLPGSLVCDALGAREDDDRTMIRTLVNMLVWNLVIVLGVVTLW